MASIDHEVKAVTLPQESLFVKGVVWGRDEAAAFTRALQTLAQPMRFRILVMLFQAGELRVTDMVKPCGLSQPAVSHHISALLEAGLIVRQMRGNRRYYSVNIDAYNQVRRLLSIPDVASS